jgi:hypothetical protein
LFGTPGTIPHPSPVLVFVDNFVRPKIASREPCVRRYSMFCKFKNRLKIF